MLVRRKCAKLSINKSTNDKIGADVNCAGNYQRKKLQHRRAREPLKRKKLTGVGDGRERGGEIRERMTGGGEGAEAYIR